jgi:hypothetical protein
VVRPSSARNTLPRAIPLVAFVAVLCAAEPVSAAPSARLVYARGAGAESCPDESALRQAIAARVGYDAFFPWAPLTVTVEVTAEGRRLRGRVVVVDADGIEKGAQTLESADESCEELLASIALAVTVALDAASRAAAKIEEPAAPPPTEPPPAPVAPSPAPAVVPAAVPIALPTRKDSSSRPDDARDSWLRPLSLWVAPGARGSFGEWRSASGGPSLLVELQAGRLGLGLEGRYDVATVAIGPTQASVQRATASAVPCLHFGWLVLCGVATFGETWARGNVAAPETDSTPYVALGGRVAADVALLPRLHLLGTVDVAGIATPTRLSVTGAGALGWDRASREDFLTADEARSQ